MTVPQESNQYFDSQKRAFGNAIWAIEESNPGYHWDWNEAALKGKMVGVLFRDREWEIEGKTGMTTEACTFVSVEDVRTNNFKMPKPKMLNKAATQTAPASNFTVLDDPDADLPF